MWFPSGEGEGNQKFPEMESNEGRESGACGVSTFVSKPHEVKKKLKKLFFP